MSHQPERAEKDCLNCGTIVQGRYCSQCGQENIVTRQSAFALIKHFVYDVFHFDGKFFDTLRHLILKPGRVPANYIQGKRLKYLDPIRMYLFTSAIFFLIFFSVQKVGEIDSSEWGRNLSKAERAEVAMELNAEIKKGKKDSFQFYVLDQLLDSTKAVSFIKNDKKENDSLIQFKGSFYKVRSRIDSSDFNQEQEYKRSGWLKRKAIERVRIMQNKYGDDLNTGIRDLLESFVHRLPYVLFISLPFFALILKLLYIRRKAFYYSDHLIFTLYHYIFSFILLLLIFGITGLKDWSGWGIFDLFIFLLSLVGVIYLYKGMRTFYGQSRGKTIIKYLMLSALGLIALLIVVTIFFVFTAFQI